jgi:prophage DNA circulation protein
VAWDQDLQDASFGGVTLEVVTVTDTFGRRLQISEYVYRDGAELEDLGREARPTELEVVFHGPDHLASLGQLQLMFETAEAATFQHPLLGTWQARIERMTVRHGHDARNESRVQLELREVGLDTELPDLFSVAAAKEELSASTLAAQAALDDLYEDIPDEVPTEATSLLDDAEAFVDDVDATLDALESRIDQINQAVANAVAKIEALGDIESYETLRRIRDISLKAKRVKDRAERLAPQVYESEVRADVPLGVLSLRLYGDPNRGEDLVRINRIRNPFVVAAGKVIKLYDR